MNCPVCPNVALVMSERQGIEIDYCPTCRGVWLDRGELDKIIERSMSSSISTQPLQGMSMGYGGHEIGHDHDKERHRRKSFLKELFD